MVEAGFLGRAKAAKVDSFWYKDLSPEDLIDVIDRTMAGEHLFPHETPQVKLGLASSAELTIKGTNDPITLTMWHVYGSQTESPLNVMIDEFNQTKGKESGIVISVVSPVFCAVVHLFAPPRFPLSLKNIDFTGVFHVFLWQRP